ncbi:MAG: 50S ribosomal protein L9, partial [Candidatus Latescibacteria bacterium]|nr:50S ribosomal protein L9 [Candidatus Latescibacterota bacterium]
DSIRALGIYNVPVRLLPDVEAKVKLWVVKE